MNEFEELNNFGENMSDEEKAKVEVAEKDKKEQEVITRVIAGHNDVFKKHYKFDELGLEFDIEIKFPNVIEQAKIQAHTERYFEGLGSLMPYRVQEAYRMLATLRVCGKKVPSFLSEDEEIYNIQIFNVIGDDFIKWMNSFRY